jgi:hypothetical protein
MAISEDKTKNHNSLIEQKFPLLTKCFGFINGLNLPVMVANDDESVVIDFE